MNTPLTAETIEKVKQYLQIPVYVCETLEVYNSIVEIQSYLPNFYPGCDLELDLDAYYMRKATGASKFKFPATKALGGLKLILDAWRLNSGTCHIYNGYFDQYNCPELLDEKVPSFKHRELKTVHKKVCLLLKSGAEIIDQPVFKTGTVVTRGGVEYIVVQSPKTYTSAIVEVWTKTGSCYAPACSSLTIAENKFPEKLARAISYLRPDLQQPVKECCSVLTNLELDAFNHCSSLYSVLRKLFESYYATIQVRTPHSFFYQFYNTTKQYTAFVHMLEADTVYNFKVPLFRPELQANFELLKTVMCERNFAKVLKATFIQSRHAIDGGWSTFASRVQGTPATVLNNALVWSDTDLTLCDGDKEITFYSAYQLIHNKKLVIDNTSCVSAPNAGIASGTGFVDTAAYDTESNVQMIRETPYPKDAGIALKSTASKAKLNFKPAKNKINIKVQTETKLKFDSGSSHDLPF